MIGKGESTGKYKILREVGRGGMGVVYLAEDLSLGRRVALKVLHASLGGDVDFVERFRREARAVAGLYHPNILRVHALEEVGGRWAIETEYVESGSLSDAMCGRGVSAFEAVRLVHETLGALSRCHAEGIVHRDVKPSNILIGAEGQALLADFGLAKALADASEDSLAARRSSALFVGTPCYAPLEAWDGGTPSQSWDIYAAGMVLYEALTGVMPFDGATVLKVMRQKANLSPAPVRELAPHVSEELSALVGRMISQDEQERPRDALLAREMLEAVPELSTPGTVNRKTVAVARRNPQRLSASLRRVKRGWVRSAPWVAGASLLALLALAPLGWWAASSVILGGAAPVERGPDVFAGTEQVLAQEGPGSEGIVLDVVEHESGMKTEAAWWLGPKQPTGERELVAQGPVTLWRATLSENAGVAHVKGAWASYLDVEGLVLRHGELTGTGSLGKAGEAVSLTITFTNDRDAATQTFTFTGARREEQWAGRRFFFDLESQRGAPALLVKELLPRGLGWAESLEAHLPGLWHERGQVPFEADLSSFKLDGVLDESFWSKRYPLGLGEAGLLSGRMQDAQAELLLRYDAHRMLLAMRLSKRPLGRTRVTLSWQPLAAFPLEESPRYSAAWIAGKLVTWETQHVMGTPKAPAFVESASGSARWTAEMELNLAESLASSAPESMLRWRLNLRIDEIDEDGTSRPLAVWGSSLPEEIPHGAILAFAGSEEVSEN